MKMTDKIQYNLNGLILPFLDCGRFLIATTCC